MTRHRPRRPALTSVLLLALAFAPASSYGQTTDCTGQRAALDAAETPGNSGRYDAAMQQQRDEIMRARAYADGIGCGDGVFDDSDAAACRALSRRVEMLQIGLRRLQAQAFRGDQDDDGRRRELRARFDAECSAAGVPGDPSVTAVPVDPDAPPGPAAPKLRRVICVRHCDGAHYPLAVDVPPDRLPDMDRICQAQCPAAESSAYASPDGEVSNATAEDGSSYASLPAAFAYLKGPEKTCACRAPRQSWAEALVSAESLLQPHKGDITVTAEISAAMARPAPTAAQQPVPAAAASRAKAPKAGKAKAAPPLTVPAPLPDRDLTREFRGSDPTL